MPCAEKRVPFPAYQRELLALTLRFNRYTDYSAPIEYKLYFPIIVRY